MQAPSPTARSSTAATSAASPPPSPPTRQRPAPAPTSSASLAVARARCAFAWLRCCVTAPLQVIKGWTEAMQLMVEGEKARLWIPSKLAYNNEPGRPMGMLVFDVELIKIL